MRETWVRPLGQEDPLEKEMATHSGTLAWKRRRLVGYSPWGRKESDTTEQLHFIYLLSVTFIFSVVERFLIAPLWGGEVPICVYVYI